VIDFRYHLVSIVAVFLALAVGLVVGATAIKPRTLQVLDSQSRSEKHQIDTQRALINDLQGQLNGDRTFAEAAAPVMLNNLLAGQRVVLVTAPGSDGTMVSGVTAALQQAGAKLTGQVALQPAFFGTSTSTENSLEAIAGSVAPPGVTLGVQTGQPNLGSQTVGQQDAAQVLAPALLTKDSGADLPASEAKRIIDGFAAQGFLQVNIAGGSATLPQATLAVVIFPAAPPASGASDPANLALISVAAELQASSRDVVLAGPLSGSGSGSVLDELINGNTGAQLSTVDDANTQVGQIEVAQALSFLVAGHNPAAYGVLSNTAPSPAPTPAATPTPARSPATSKSGG
jgi:hypothetical protein